MPEIMNFGYNDREEGQLEEGEVKTSEWSELVDKLHQRNSVLAPVLADLQPEKQEALSYAFNMHGLNLEALEGLNEEDDKRIVESLARLDESEDSKQVKDICEDIADLVEDI